MMNLINKLVKDEKRPGPGRVRHRARGHRGRRRRRRRAIAGNVYDALDERPTARSPRRSEFAPTAIATWARGARGDPAPLVPHQEPNAHDPSTDHSPPRSASSRSASRPTCGRRRIPNLLSGVGIVAGVVLNTLYFGADGLLASGAGFAAALALLLFPFAMGGIGGGDVKMMGAIGALLGPRAGLAALLVGPGPRAASIMAIHLARLGRLRRDACAPSAPWWRPASSAARSIRSGSPPRSRSDHAPLQRAARARDARPCWRRRGASGCDDAPARRRQRGQALVEMAHRRRPLRHPGHGHHRVRPRLDDRQHDHARGAGRRARRRRPPTASGRGRHRSRIRPRSRPRC